MAKEVKRLNTKRGYRYVEVLPTGQYKFIKKAVYDRIKGNKPKKASNPSVTRKKSGGNKRVAKKGFLGKLSGVGMLEDFAWGYMGFNLLGQTPAALPLTRTIQGIQGYVFDRRGKYRALDGILDCLVIWSSGGWGRGARRRNGQNLVQLILAPLQNLAKIRPL